MRTDTSTSADGSVIETTRTTWKLPPGVVFRTAFWTGGGLCAGALAVLGITSVVTKILRALGVM